MKRDFLRNLDLGDGARLPDAAIDAIMTEHGKTVTPLHDSITALTGERDTLQTQLTDIQTQLSEAQGWETKYNTDTQALQAQLTALQNDINIRNARDKVSAATGVPASLLTGETEKDCKAQADAILKWHGTQPKYPGGSDGGEKHPPAGGTTREQFADWAKSAMNQS